MSDSFMTNRNLTVSLSNTTVNRTLSYPIPATTAQPSLLFITFSIVSVVIFILGIIFSAAVLLPLILDRSVRTSFSVYIINLIGSNLLRLIVQSVPTVLTVVLYRNTWPLAPNLCMSVLYLSDVLRIGAISLHALIGLNRIWAILHPVSYRTRHSTRFAVITCATLWTFINLVYGVFPLVERHEKSAENPDITCAQLATIVSYSKMILNFLGVIVPLVGNLLALPVIVLLMYRNRFLRATPSIQPVGNSTDATPTVEAKLPVNESCTQEAVERMERRNQAMREKQLFLTLLTASVVICYVPYFGYTVLTMFVKDFWDASFLMILILFYQCQSILDALLFLLMFKDLRLSLRRYLAALACRGRKD